METSRRRLFALLGSTALVPAAALAKPAPKLTQNDLFVLMDYQIKIIDAFTELMDAKVQIEWQSKMLSNLSSMIEEQTQVSRTLIKELTNIKWQSLDYDKLNWSEEELKSYYGTQIETHWIDDEETSC